MDYDKITELCRHFSVDNSLLKSIYDRVIKKKQVLLDKAALEPGKTGRHQVILPVGSMVDPGPGAIHGDGRIKVRKPDGKTAWRSVRAGLVQADDGTPTSSRNPNPGKKSQSQPG